MSLVCSINACQTKHILKVKNALEERVAKEDFLEWQREMQLEKNFLCLQSASPRPLADLST